MYLCQNFTPNTPYILLAIDVKGTAQYFIKVKDTVGVEYAYCLF